MVTAKQTVCLTTLKEKLDPSLSEGLLFLHAVSGCDTTSRPYGIGKVTVFRKFTELKNSISTFLNPNSSKEAIKEAGEKALLEIYSCSSSEAWMQHGSTSFRWRWLLLQATWHQRSSLPLPMQQHTTAIAPIIRYRRGEEMTFHQPNGDGQCQPMDLYLYGWQTQNISCT